MEQNYSSDAPLFDPKLDMFNRYPFAKRVSNVIANRKDSSSIAIGIYGAWGEGKTSVLNFIEKELLNEPEVVILKFNPWRFGNEDEMLIYFFYELANVIGKKLQTGKEIASDVLEKYLKLPAALIGKTDIANEVVSMLSKVDVKELRDRIEKILAQEKKRVVILVDDIDRLEKKEIHAIFRLVKLTADMDYTAYVLAFDKYVVSSALQERYGSSNESTGNSFLEKIIQVPLYLPQINYEDLRQFCFKEIDKVLKETESNLTQTEISQFTGYFSIGIEPNLKTPRQAKLYANILTFSLPLLKNEVSIVDLMLIEGIRVFMPELYKLIRDNKNIFLSEINQTLATNNDDEIKSRRNLIDEVLGEYPEETSKQIIDLICFLFPKLNSIFNNTHYGNDWESKWEENQRICSAQYFQRYFTYAISSRDISDIAIDNLLQISKTCSVNEMVERIKQIVNENNIATFLTKLRRLSKKLTPSQSKIFALSLAKLDSMLPNPDQLFNFLTPFGQAVLFISACIENLETKEEKNELAEEIILRVSSLSFAIECLFGFPRDKETRPNPKGFSKEEFVKLTIELTKRISHELNQIDKLNINQFNSFSKLLYIWNEYGDKKQASDFLVKQIERNKNFVFELLDAYTSTAYTFGEFGSSKSNFEKESYDSLKKVINPTILVNAMDEVYPNLQSDERYPEFLEDVSRNEELARQFKWLHDNIQKDNK